MATALAEAIANLDVRFGARTVATAGAAAERDSRRRFLTGTAFDAVSGGIATGSVYVLAGEGTSGKLTVALRTVAGAQRDGGMALWVDPSRSFDPLAALRSGVDLRRVIVVRAPGREGTLIATAAGLRSEGSRIVVVDLGPSFAQVASADGLAPVVAHVRGSTAALVIVADRAPQHLGGTTFAFERAGWEQRHGRTAGWTFAVRRAGAPAEERALLREAV